LSFIRVVPVDGQAPGFRVNHAFVAGSGGSGAYGIRVLPDLSRRLDSERIEPFVDIAKLFAER
jgi:hypothetical protein